MPTIIRITDSQDNLRIKLEIKRLIQPIFPTKMTIVRWSQEKNEKLRQERGVTFEMVLESMQKGAILDDIEHPNQEKYPNQRMMVICINNYAFLVPYVNSTSELFLKTIIPSRKATKKYLGEIKNNDQS